MTCDKKIENESQQCPKPDPNLYCFVCNDACVSDYECRKKSGSSPTAICCQQPSCGNTCKEPTKPKTCDDPIKNPLSYRCPPHSNKKCVDCNDQCTKNADCPKEYGRNQICCPQKSCGNYCTQPTPISASVVRSKLARF